MKAAYNAVYVEARYHGRASVKTENSTAEPIMKKCMEQNAVAARQQYQRTSL